MAVHATNLEEVVAAMKPKPGVPVPSVSSPSPALQAALQAAMNKRMAEMRQEFDAAMRQVLADAEAIQQSDLLTVRLSDGEEVILYRTEVGDTQQLLNWLLQNGWQPIG